MRRTILLTISIVGLSLVVAAFIAFRPPTTAGPVADDTSASKPVTGEQEDGGKEEDSLETVRRAAEQGNVFAQCSLGYMYAKGNGVPKDPQQAVAWFRKAAEQGDAMAQFNLGNMYYRGDGVPKDAQLAIAWYRKAAEQGDAMAQFNLGNIYYKGEGVPMDAQEAVVWYRTAAEQGVAAAQYNFGAMYAKGEGVPKDAQQAVVWYRKAAEQGYAQAQFNLGLTYSEGTGVPKDAQQAVVWYRKAAEQGAADAQFCLGHMYAKGEGVPKNLVLAYKWYSLGAAGGEEIARSGRDATERQMTREQVAEAQRLAADFKAHAEDKTPAPDTSGPFAGSATSPAEAPRSSGTGFFVSSNGYLLTAAHVVEGARRASVRTGQGLVAAKVIRTDASNDVALLKIEGTAKPLPLASSREVKLGDTAFTVGFPNIGMQGVSPKLTKGEINALSGIQDDPRSFQISVAVQPGNSGGPLVDASGNVVGLVQSRLSDRAALAETGALPQTVNYALKSAYVLPMLESVADLQKSLPVPRRAEKRDFTEVVRESEEAVCLILVW